LPAAAGTYVVVASRGRFDEEAVEQALSAGAVYVALIANKKRAREIPDSLKALSHLQKSNKRDTNRPHLPYILDFHSFGTVPQN
jgi:xanthine/CO dehydrogenase XdhC/CoxF family maturation factor